MNTLNPIQARLTATLTAIAGLLGLGAVHFGVTLPAEVAASIVALVAIIVSVIAPRWAEARGVFLDAHPAALSAVFTAIAVWVAPLFGVTLTEADALVLVSGITAIVGSLTPRKLDPYPYNVETEWSKDHSEIEEPEPEIPDQPSRRERLE